MVGDFGATLVDPFEAEFRLVPKCISCFQRADEALRDALVKYRLYGSVELDEAMDTIAGSLLCNQETIRAEPQENKEIIDKFFEMLTKVNTLVSGYQSAAQLAAPAATALLLKFIGETKAC